MFAIFPKITVNRMICTADSGWPRKIEDGLGVENLYVSQHQEIEEIADTGAAL